MRLLSFVPCGCRAGPIDDAPPAALPAANCSGAGDGGAAARRRRRRARSLGGSPQWRPSLGDIYEECTGSAEATKARRSAAAAGLIPPRAGRSAVRDAARVLPRAHSDEYRHIETAASMPAFAPAAFLF
ncbi:hypothetical protein E2562_010167 [Oryza meyeriana var. granulata]|uniref:Uncharacterized protein n=1 Tax=Oryza meyeriana var. granulata TaxID=110450 RepID=A0A6G1EJD5_9ORYZ|nr:hypothetical protein E2562_010167 [Oryza meyeriana var. granulata]